MEAKNLLVEIKAGPDDGLADGEFTAYASVFNNVDSYGDVVMPGAFTATLESWKSSGAPIPVYWGHNIADPDFNIGEIVEAVEDEHGLKVRARLDLDNPKSAQTYRLLKGRRVREMSFGFATVKAADAERDGRYVRELTELKLFEVSVVPVGANPDTEVISVRSAAASIAASVKAGHPLSAKSETTIRSAAAELRSAADALDSILPAPSEGGDNDDQGKASGNPSVADGDATASKSGASVNPSVDDLAAMYEFHLSERSLA